MTRFGLRGLGAAFLLAAAIAAAAQSVSSVATREPRVALLIGNARYKDSPLLNPVNDAKALGASLREAGFEVVELHNASALQMRRAIREFGERLRQNGAGLFYFAGHGVQVRGRNFLVPVDADVRYEDEIEDQSIDVSLVIGKMETAKARVNLVILDACRNNPFVRNSRSPANGLAPMEAPTGTLIAFATSPGQVADDGRGGNGLYTQYLVREMSQRGLKVEDVFKRVRGSVRVASAGRQVPWENTSLEGDFYFHAPDIVDAAAAEGERRRQQEEAIQAAVRDALARSREESERERKRLEQAYAEKLEAEKEALRKEAFERLAAIEKAALATTRPAAQPAALEAAQPIDPAAPVGAAQPLAAPQLATGERAAPADEPASDGQEMPASFLLALGVDPANRNKLKPMADDVARALAPARPQPGDTWTYFREIRDGGGVTRRNYVTNTATFADEGGYTAVHSDASVPTRYDGSGNRLSTPYSPVSSSNTATVFEPVETLFRFPLTPGATWSDKVREISPTGSVSATSDVKVVGWEEVTVPAGRFRAMKVAQIQYRSWEPFPGQSQESKRVTNVWYVPSVRAAARMEVLEVTSKGLAIFDQTWELDSFDLR
jgi:uncharacterized caspase-like protein